MERKITTRVKEGQDDKRGSREEDWHDRHSFTGSAAEMEMVRARCQNAPSTMDAKNDNVGPENRMVNSRETKDEVGRRLQKDSRDTVVYTSQEESYVESTGKRRYPGAMNEKCTS